jgi:flavin-binding protein dodecin
MSVAKVTELICDSSKSFDDAIAQGIQRADKTLRNVSGAWVESQKLVVEKGKIVKYRVILKVTFVLDD